MPSEVEEVLAYLARVTAQVSPAQFALGWLFANADRVQFTDRTQVERGLAMTFGVHRRIEIPMVPWVGYIRGVPVPDPVIWVQAAKEWGRQPVVVRVATDDHRLAGLLAPLVKQYRGTWERGELEQHIQQLRGEVDRALDLYNEIRHIMEVEPERHAELAAFLEIAQRDMQHLGQRLRLLKERLEQQGQG